MALVEDLRQTFRDKPASVVLIVGTGVAVGALRGAPCSHLATWEGLLRSGLQRIQELQKMNADELAGYQSILANGNLKAWLMIAGRIEDELGAPDHGEFSRWLRETVGTFKQHVTDRSVLAALAAHQRRGALLATTNYDLLLEDATGLDTVTWRDRGGVERALRGDEPQVLHLHGAWRWPESIVLGVKSYAGVARDAHAQSVLTTLRTGRTFVFVGCGAGLRDPNLGDFLRWTADVFKGSEYRHYRLCLDTELDALKAEHPNEQRIFPLSYGATHAELAPFLRSLLPPGASDAPPARPAHRASNEGDSHGETRTPIQSSTPAYPYDGFRAVFRDIIPPIELTGGRVLNLVFGDISKICHLTPILPVNQDFDMLQRGQRSVLAAFEKRRVGTSLFFDAVESSFPQQSRPRNSAIGECCRVDLSSYRGDLSDVIFTVTTRNISSADEDRGLYVETPFSGIQLVLRQIARFIAAVGTIEVAVPLLGAGYANISRTWTRPDAALAIQRIVLLRTIDALISTLGVGSGTLRRAVVVVYSAQPQSGVEHSIWETVLEFVTARTSGRKRIIAALEASFKAAP